jgi:hypothetical protein
MSEDDWVLADEDTIAGAVRTLGPRKARLFASAACRALGRWVSHPAAVEALEANDRFADTGKTKAALKRARQGVRAARHKMDEHIPEGVAFHYPIRYEALWSVEVACSENVPHAAAEYAARTLRMAEDVREETSRRQLYPAYRDIGGHLLHLIAFDPSWRTSTAVGLARTLYETRDFGAMPILADALEEAGCDDATILSHCRGDGPHVRGCWVVDLILGKS